LICDWSFQTLSQRELQKIKANISSSFQHITKADITVVWAEQKDLYDDVA
jgi:hypothetical protein